MRSSNTYRTHLVITNKAKLMDLLNKKLKQIVDDNLEHFAIFAAQGYSFEEWLNLELCVALNKDLSIKKNAVWNTPKYKHNNGERLDIGFTYKDENYAIELKIAHPSTLEQYKNSCKHDIEKLSSAKEYHHRFFVLLIVSTLSAEEFASDEVWGNWVNDIFKEGLGKLDAIDLGDSKGSVNIYMSEITYKPTISK